MEMEVYSVGISLAIPKLAQMGMWPWAEHKKGVSEQVLSPLQGNALLFCFQYITIKYAYLASSILLITYVVLVLFDIVFLNLYCITNVCARICYKIVY